MTPRILSSSFPPITPDKSSSLSPPSKSCLFHMLFHHRLKHMLVIDNLSFVSATSPAKGSEHLSTSVL
ncbi:hypothetical protein L249_5213 [Ophiocordyceps polyrhachis-furcata BCC 54312]|uniref:Uncharacterized protein n=1 Tax=Ophiocordyceps polyrhachis-furcata BCC 54312 TaxID=1330021 RepID=A0A367L9F5_9HYPO|nr:hypothetical protein L249_5213 [Ophiocordyceps polyrhachis-furcata BCC 54312]